jgi:hypothetical protein
LAAAASAAADTQAATSPVTTADIPIRGHSLSNVLFILASSQFIRRMNPAPRAGFRRLPARRFML